MRRVIWPSRKSSQITLNAHTIPGCWKRAITTSQRVDGISFIHTHIDEERLHVDRLKYFHETHPGQILNGNYKTITKLAFGSSATIWLAEDLKLFVCPFHPSIPTQHLH